MYMNTQECHIQVRCTGSIKTLIMLDSPENLYMMVKNFIVKPAISSCGGRCLNRMVNEVIQTLVTRSSIPKKS
jgi:hypothetical protein